MKTNEPTARLDRKFRRKLKREAKKGSENIVEFEAWVTHTRWYYMAKFLKKIGATVLLGLIAGKPAVIAKMHVKGEDRAPNKPLTVSEIMAQL